MTLKPLRLLITACTVLALVPAVASADTSAAPPRASSNMQLVAQIPGAGGTDLEFFSRDLASYRDASGATVTPETPARRHFAMVGNQTSGAKIYDVTTPDAPYLASAVKNCTVGQGDVQVTDDGLVAAIAYVSGSCKTFEGKSVKKGSALLDLSDVYAPRVVGGAAEALGAHNNTIDPSGKYLYISTSGIAETTGRVPIYDISNPAAPRLVQVWTTPGNSPHDIRFSPDGKRAYMAGISQYRIVDTSNIEKPALISTIIPPGGSIGHDTLVTNDRAFLFLGDEGGGGAEYPCPGGAIYAYDIRNEAVPVLLGAAEAGVGPVTGRQVDEPGAGGVGGCTSHVMDLNPDGRSLTLGWYVGGTRTFSFASFYDAAGQPKPGPALAYGKNGVGLVESGYMVPEGADTWSAKQYSEVPGYIFSNDISLGLYVTKIK